MAEKTISNKTNVKKPVDHVKADHKEHSGNKEMLAIIRIRGNDDVNFRIEDTLRMLKLHKKHTCSFYPKNDVMSGMAHRCKDYVTYGEIDDETYKLLIDKRGIKDKNGKVLNYCHLHPPRGGFGRRGIKFAFQNKGALGYRGAKINELIKKMM